MSNSTEISTPIFYKNDGFNQLNKFLKKTNYSSLFVLIDENTQLFCLPTLKKQLVLPFTFIPIRAGEKHKNLKTCQILWDELARLGADRNSILINLGGGVITDMGGFVAATFKRGMRFINIPTTLLGMVDAAIGGKTGIDFQHLKNQIGLFAKAEMTLIYPNFLDTLAPRELHSGLAEVIKYGLIDTNTIWEYIKSLDTNSISIDENIIKKSAQLKEQIVKQDPTEKGIRKTLNFGHTLGHAIETHFMSKPKKQQLLHGEAVAIGMILAVSLSSQTQGFPTANEIAKIITSIYPKVTFTTEDYPIIFDLLKHDKKNVNGQLNFVLLQAIGKPVINCQVTENEIMKAFTFYNSL